MRAHPPRPTRSSHGPAAIVAATALALATHKAVAQPASGVRPSQGTAPIALAPIAIEPAPRTPQRLRPTDERAALLAPGPGRAPLRIEARGGPLELGVPTPVARSGGLPAAGTPVDTPEILCRAPCVLYPPVGPFRVFARGGGLAGRTYSVWVPASGRRVVLRTPNAGAYGTGIVISGLGLLALIAGLFVALPPDGGASTAEVAGGLVSIGVGLGLGCAGVALGTAFEPAIIETH